MSIENSFQTLKYFDFNGASASLWLFKKRPTAYSAYWIKTTDKLQLELKNIADSYMQNFIEFESYSLLNQTNENSVLGLESNKTEFNQLQTLIDRPEEDCIANNKKQLHNSAGYLVEYTNGGVTIVAVKKTNTNWKTRKSNNVLNLVFREQELDIEEDPAFSINKNFDFFVVNNYLLIANKPNFESLLSFKDNFIASFNTLVTDKKFIGIFSDIKVLQDYVGTNSIQLRRMAQIKEKSFYLNPDFIKRLRTLNDSNKWGIQFNAQGQITPTEDTIKLIVQLLLDHRLLSELSLIRYDVPSATAL